MKIKTVGLFFMILIGMCLLWKSKSKAQYEKKYMELTSDAFEDGGKIPTEFTCDGQDISPPLSWENIPKGTKSFVLICDDPDAPAGTWVHWVAFNISKELTYLVSGANITGPNVGGVIGKNSWEKSEYGGPCPPIGTHRYYFKLYALDVPSLFDLDSNATKKDVISAMSGHTLSKAVLMGRYERKP